MIVEKTQHGGAVVGHELMKGATKSALPPVEDHYEAINNDEDELSRDFEKPDTSKSSKKKRYTK